MNITKFRAGQFTALGQGAVESRPQAYDSLDAALQFARIQTWVQPGGTKDRQLQALLRERLVERDGRFAFTWYPPLQGIVTWRPGRTSPPG